MGFRGSLACLVLLAVATPAVVLAAPPAADAAAPAASAAAPAATPADATKAAEAAFHKLRTTETKPGDAKAGKTKAAACGACHGMDGNSTVAEYPKLAGQNAQYIVTQLMRFKTGLRQNAIMQGMAAPLSVQDMEDIAAYFAAQKRSPGVADPELAKAGAKLYHEGDASRKIPACMACHGPDGAGNPGWRVPDIAGQHAEYVQSQLKAWHDGASWGTDTHSKIMPAIAERLTEQDIAAVSSYVQGLHAAPPPKKITHTGGID